MHLLEMEGSGLTQTEISSQVHSKTKAGSGGAKGRRQRNGTIAGEVAGRSQVGDKAVSHPESTKNKKGTNPRQLLV